MKLSSRASGNNAVTIKEDGNKRTISLRDRPLDKYGYVFTGEATFDPPTVKIRGPRAVLARAEQTSRSDNQGRLILYAALPDDATRTPGHYDFKEVGLKKPPELDEEHVSLISPTSVKASVDVRRFSSGERIVFLPYGQDTWQTTQAWLRERALFGEQAPAVAFADAVTR